MNLLGDHLGENILSSAVLWSPLDYLSSSRAIMRRYAANCVPITSYATHAHSPYTSEHTTQRERKVRYIPQNMSFTRMRLELLWRT